MGCANQLLNVLLIKNVINIFALTLLRFSRGTHINKILFNSILGSPKCLMYKKYVNASKGNIYYHIHIEQPIVLLTYRACFWALSNELCIFFSFLINMQVKFLKIFKINVRVVFSIFLTLVIFWILGLTWKFGYRF